MSWHSPSRPRTQGAVIVAAALTISTIALTFYLRLSLGTSTFHTQPPLPATSTSKQATIQILGQPLNPTHPRLFANASKWDSLLQQIPGNDYLSKWNETIFRRAQEMLSLPPPTYRVDGTSGILDIARTVQLRIKYWAYAHRLTGDPKWKDRIWREVVYTSGNSTASPFGKTGDNWNTEHWLDVGEFLVAFGIAYDWLYDAWTAEEREGIRWSIVDLGLKKGLESFERGDWFLGVTGNWNCVTVGGMIVGSLAVLGDDTTGVAMELLGRAVKNAEEYCGRSVDGSGTWVETPDYWYFGTQAHAQLSSALLTSLGNTFGMMDSHPKFRDTGLFHIYNLGMTEKFNYGDCGPSKITATANSLLFYGNEYGIAEYGSFQRDRPDAADPLSILWYDSSLNGQWHDHLPLDKAFSDPSGAWVSMRSSWTDTNGVFVAMKAGKMSGHATHGNLDAGDFVLDALGERWAAELCQESYDAPGYFSSEEQKSIRWDYYRCGTSGQNTIVYNNSNQIVDAEPMVRFESSLATQKGRSSTDAGALWTADLSQAYDGMSITRGVWLLKGRSKVLVQDEITDALETSQWRMHTRAEITYSNSGRTAHLRLNGRALDVVLLSPSAATFYTTKPVRSPKLPPQPSDQRDLPNTGVSVLAIDLRPGNSTAAVLFCPLSEPDVPCSSTSPVALSEWALL
ncbi:chondroitin AC/alginate lyase [Cercophora samala]|uniref:Chondroitin AC/alginate lyase n=1 Tax=Cercophora samala TaxID=330535 RepID=A0AA39YX93_9PEZI|nr:chondroitin AC/alginate lyase [Cercophora samala]